MPEAVQTNRRTAQAKHADAVRWHKPNQAETARDFAYARLEDYIRQIVDAAPPLTDAQKATLSRLLQGSTPSGVGAP